MPFCTLLQTKLWHISDPIIKIWTHSNCNGMQWQIPQQM